MLLTAVEMDVEQMSCRIDIDKITKTEDELAMAKKQVTPPVHQFLNVMVPLYFKDKIDGYKSLDKQTKLSPMAAVCLGAMAIDKKISPVGIEMLLRPHGLDRAEAAIVSEIGFIELLRDGYVKLATKKDEEAYEARDIGNWGIQAGIHFVITAKGAKRIAHLVATMSVGKTLDSRIGVELGSGLEEALKHYLEILDVADRTRRDRRNHLHLIRRLHLELVVAGGKKIPVVTSLSVELRSAIAKTGQAPKTLAKTIGVHPSAMQRWLTGAMPNARGIPSLHRLESALQLPRGHLVGLIGEAPAGAVRQSIVIPYRERQKERARDRYIIPESDLMPEFKVEWQTLFDYKTTTFPMLERHPRGHWRCIPVNTSVRMGPLATRGNTVCPSAQIALDRLRTFFGVISLSTSLRGMFSGEAPQTLAWLAFPTALNTYLEWVTQRSDGVIHNGQKVFCRLVAGLLRPTTGYS